MEAYQQSCCRSILSLRLLPFGEVELMETPRWSYVCGGELLGFSRLLPFGEVELMETSDPRNSFKDLERLHKLLPFGEVELMETFIDGTNESVFHVESKKLLPFGEVELMETVFS
jgi:hypothetical protein